MPSPFASPAAIADESEQPVPWVFFVAMRGAASAVTPEESIKVQQVLDAIYASARTGKEARLG